MVPSGFSLTLYTYLFPINLQLESLGTKVHVSFFSKALYSSSIAFFQFGSFNASEVFKSNAICGWVETWYNFGLKIPALDLVTIGCDGTTSFVLGAVIGDEGWSFV